VKTYKNLFEKIINFENLLLAAKQAQRGKRMKIDVAGFNFGLEGELLKLQDELRTQSYRPGNYRHFYINDPKRRLISAAPYRDRIVHHAYCNIVEPIFDKAFIYHSYACRLNKGTHKALDRCQSFLRANQYVLQCDISKYFSSVNHQVLLSLIVKKIKDKKVISLTELIIGSGAAGTKGIPIGNLTSQFFANLYLNELDYFIKFDLKERYYLRYMDDFLIFSNDKKDLHGIKEKLRLFLGESLRLDLHLKKTIIFPVKLGVDFCGFRIFKDYRRLRRTNVLLFNKRMKKLRGLFRQGRIEVKDISHSIRCWIAHASYGNTYNLRKKLLEKLVFKASNDVSA
jgi:retron-type reverse transcriptase